MTYKYGGGNYKFYVYDCGGTDENRFMPRAEIDGEEIWFDMSCTDRKTAERNLEFGKACFFAGQKKAFDDMKNFIKGKLP